MQSPAHTRPLPAQADGIGHPCLAVAYCLRPSEKPITHIARVLLVVDMALSCISAFPLTRGSLQLRPKQIAIAYLRSYFVIDLFALLPIEYGMVAERNRMISWQLFHVPRWFTLWLNWDNVTPREHSNTDAHHSMRAAERAEELSMGCGSYAVLDRRPPPYCSVPPSPLQFRSITTTNNNGVLQIFKFLLLLLVITHCASCFFYAAAGGPSLCETDENASGWLEQSQQAVDWFNRIHKQAFKIETKNSTQENTYELYVVHVFLAFSALLGDGAGANMADTWLLAMGLMLIGNVMVAVVFGEVLLALSNLKRSAEAYTQRMQEVNESMNHDQLPERLQRRVRRFFEFRWLAVRGDVSAQHQYLGELPAGLHVMLSLELFGPLIRKVRVLRDRPI